MNAPIDRTHEESMRLTRWIRSLIRDRRKAAALWEPLPMPEDWNAEHGVRSSK